MIDDHQRERMRAWALFCASMMPRPAPHPERDADSMLAEFDKRFPAPSAAVTYDPVTGIFDGTPSAAAPVEPNANFGTFLSHAELAALRQKARLWDAVADGAINLSYYESAGFQASWPAPAANGGTARCGSGSKHTAEEAVEAAIAAGALK